MEDKELAAFIENAVKTSKDNVEALSKVLKFEKESRQLLEFNCDNLNADDEHGDRTAAEILALHLAVARGECKDLSGKEI